MNTLTITIANQLFALRHLFYSLFVFVFLFLLARGQDMPYVFIAIALAPYTLPAICIHVQYYLKNRHEVISVFKDSIELINSMSGCVRIPFQEIQSLELHASGGVFKKIDWENLSFQSYHYLLIKHKDNLYYITSLMSKAVLEKELEDMIGINKNKYKRVKRFIPYLY